jgi:hypothetical protein
MNPLVPLRDPIACPTLIAAGDTRTLSGIWKVIRFSFAIPGS